MKRSLEPQPDLWRALDQGRLLRAVLVDFYERVFVDPRLAPFFHATTKSWVIDHQYAFLCQILTGENVYFGERPRNAHHWMVIDDALFDHREALFATVLADHGLSAWTGAFQRIHEAFRSQIVKPAAFPKKRAGVALPLEGWESIGLSAGGLCDVCGEVVEMNATVHYHVRTGRVSCARCTEKAGGPEALP